MAKLLHTSTPVNKLLNMVYVQCFLNVEIYAVCAIEADSSGIRSTIALNKWMSTPSWRPALIGPNQPPPIAGGDGT